MTSDSCKTLIARGLNPQVSDVLPFGQSSCKHKWLKRCLFLHSEIVTLSDHKQVGSFLTCRMLVSTRSGPVAVGPTTALTRRCLVTRRGPPTAPPARSRYAFDNFVSVPDRWRASSFRQNFTLNNCRPLIARGLNPQASDVSAFWAKQPQAQVAQKMSVSVFCGCHDFRS